MKKLAEVRDKIAKYDAELKMSRAEAEMAKLASDLNFDVTTDFGQIEQVINERISLNRASTRRGRHVERRRRRYPARAGHGVGPGRTGTARF